MTELRNPPTECDYCHSYYVNAVKVWCSDRRKRGWIIKCNSCRRETLPHRFKFMSAIAWAMGFC